MKREEPQRLVDYFVIAGSHHNTELQPLQKQRRDSFVAIDGISDVKVIFSNKPRDLPEYYERIDQTIGGSAGSLNGGSFFSSSVHLCFLRSHVDDSITDLQLIFIDRGEQCPKKFIQLPGNLNKNAVGRNIALCVEKDPRKPPIINISLVNTSIGEAVPPGYKQVARSVNSGSPTGYNMFIVYQTAPNRAKKRGLFHDRYKPEIIDRYPPTNYPDSELSHFVPMFCFPRGIQVSREFQLPQKFTFVFTTEDGEELFVSALTFHEQRNRRRHRSKNSNSGSRQDSSTPTSGAQKATQIVWVPKCICIVSHYPFYEGFQTILMQLYRITASKSSLPFERYLGNLFHDVPMPMSHTPGVTLSIGVEKVTFVRSPKIGMPVHNFSLRPLFLALDIRNIVKLFALVMLEHKIVIASEHVAVLCPVAEALRSFMFPFKWQFNFIPMLPASLSSFLQAPCPFIVGLHRSFLEEIRVDDGVAVVDLDRNTIQCAKEPFQSDVRISGRVYKKLNAALHSHSNIFREESGFGGGETLRRTDPTLDHAPLPFEVEDSRGLVFNEKAIFLDFLQFWVNVMRGYSGFIVSDGQSDLTFDRKGFEVHQPQYMQGLISKLCETMTFEDFVMRRTAMEDKLDPALIFFDWCLAMDRMSGHRKLDLDTITATTDFYQIENPSKPYQVPEPSGAGLPEKAEFEYPHFPRLNVDLIRHESDAKTQQALKASQHRRVPTSEQGSLEGVRDLLVRKKSKKKAPRSNSGSKKPTSLRRKRKSNNKRAPSSNSSTRSRRSSAAKSAAAQQGSPSLDAKLAAKAPVANAVATAPANAAHVQTLADAGSGVPSSTQPPPPSTARPDSLRRISSSTRQTVVEGKASDVTGDGKSESQDLHVDASAESKVPPLQSVTSNASSISDFSDLASPTPPSSAGGVGSSKSFTFASPAPGAAASSSEVPPTATSNGIQASPTPNAASPFADALALSKQNSSIEARPSVEKVASSKSLATEQQPPSVTSSHSLPGDAVASASTPSKEAVLDVLPETRSRRRSSSKHRKSLSEASIKISPSSNSKRHSRPTPAAATVVALSLPISAAAPTSAAAAVSPSPPSDAAAASSPLLPMSPDADANAITITRTSPQPTAANRQHGEVSESSSKTPESESKSKVSQPSSPPKTSDSPSQESALSPKAAQSSQKKSVASSSSSKMRPRSSSTSQAALAMSRERALSITKTIYARCLRMCCRELSAHLKQMSTRKYDSALADPTRLPTWPLISAVYDAWFTMFSMAANTRMAYGAVCPQRDFLSMLITFDRMVKKGYTPSERIFRNLALLPSRANMGFEHSIVDKWVIRSSVSCSVMFYEQHIRASVIHDLEGTSNPDKQAHPHKEFCSNAERHPYRGSLNCAPRSLWDFVRDGLPALIRTSCVCVSCNMELAGEEIFAGMFAASKNRSESVERRTTFREDDLDDQLRGSVACPYCRATNVEPWLIVQWPAQHPAAASAPSASAPSASCEGEHLNSGENKEGSSDNPSGGNSFAFAKFDGTEEPATPWPRSPTSRGRRKRLRRPAGGGEGSSHRHHQHLGTSPRSPSPSPTPPARAASPLLARSSSNVSLSAESTASSVDEGGDSAPPPPHGGGAEIVETPETRVRLVSPRTLDSVVSQICEGLDQESALDIIRSKSVLVWNLFFYFSILGLSPHFLVGGNVEFVRPEKPLYYAYCSSTMPWAVQYRAIAEPPYLFQRPKADQSKKHRRQHSDEPSTVSVSSHADDEPSISMSLSSSTTTSSVPSATPTLSRSSTTPATSGAYSIVGANGHSLPPLVIPTDGPGGGGVGSASHVSSPPSPVSSRSPTLTNRAAPSGGIWRSRSRRSSQSVLPHVHGTAAASSPSGGRTPSAKRKSFRDKRSSKMRSLLSGFRSPTAARARENTASFGVPGSGSGSSGSGVASPMNSAPQSASASPMGGANGGGSGSGSGLAYSSAPTPPASAAVQHPPRVLTDVVMELQSLLRRDKVRDACRLYLTERSRRADHDFAFFEESMYRRLSQLRSGRRSDLPKFAKKYEEALKKLSSHDRALLYARDGPVAPLSLQVVQDFQKFFDNRSKYSKQPAPITVHEYLFETAQASADAAADGSLASLTRHPNHRFRRLSRVHAGLGLPANSTSVSPMPSTGHSPGKKFSFLRKASSPGLVVPPGLAAGATGHGHGNPSPPVLGRRSSSSVSRSRSLSRSQGSHPPQPQQQQPQQPPPARPSSAAANSTQHMSPGSPLRRTRKVSTKAASSDTLLTISPPAATSSKDSSHEPFPTPSEASSLSHNHSPLASPRTSVYSRSHTQDAIGGGGGGDTLAAPKASESRPSSLSRPTRLSRMHEPPPVSSSSALFSSISAPNAGALGLDDNAPSELTPTPQMPSPVSRSRSSPHLGGGRSGSAETSERRLERIFSSISAFEDGEQALSASLDKYSIPRKASSSLSSLEDAAHPAAAPAPKDVSAASSSHLSPPQATSSHGAGGGSGGHHHAHRRSPTSSLSGGSSRAHSNTQDYDPLENLHSVLCASTNILLEKCRELPLREFIPALRSVLCNAAHNAHYRRFLERKFPALLKHLHFWQHVHAFHKLYVKNYSWSDSRAASPSAAAPPFHISPSMRPEASSAASVSPLLSGGSGGGALAMAHHPAAAHHQVQVSPLLLKAAMMSKLGGGGSGGGGNMMRGGHHFRSSLMPRDERDATAAEFAMGIYRKFIAREGQYCIKFPPPLKRLPTPPSGDFTGTDAFIDGHSRPMLDIPTEIRSHLFRANNEPLEDLPASSLHLFDRAQHEAFKILYQATYRDFARYTLGRSSPDARLARSSISLSLDTQSQGGRYQSSPHLSSTSTAKVGAVGGGSGGGALSPSAAAPAPRGVASRVTHNAAVDGSGDRSPSGGVERKPAPIVTVDGETKMVEQPVTHSSSSVMGKPSAKRDLTVELRNSTNPGEQKFVASSPSQEKGDSTKPASMDAKGGEPGGHRPPLSPRAVGEAADAGSSPRPISPTSGAQLERSGAQRNLNKAAP